MSIIERAAGRLNRDKRKDDGQAEPQAAAGSEADVTSAASPRTGDRIADAMARNARETSVQSAEVTMQAAAPAPAPASKAVAPERQAPQTAETGSAPASAPNRQERKTIEIDLAQLNERGFITVGGGRSLIAEQFRMIKRSLIKKAFEPADASGNPNNLIMITSSLPGEGKTFCSINLAMSIAMELDHTVLLVDVDVARPNVLRTLGIEPAAGLMDVLLDEDTDIMNVMLKTNVDTLSILPSGRSHSHAAELLASQNMHALLTEIASRYPDRIVIFDSPPLLLTSEAHVLAAKMGQIVFIVEAESTSQQAVKASLEQLKGCPNVSLLYNKSGSFPGAQGYGYGYGYGKYY